MPVGLLLTYFRMHRTLKMRIIVTVDPVAWYVSLSCDFMGLRCANTPERIEVRLGVKTFDFWGSKEHS